MNTTFHYLWVSFLSLGLLSGCATTYDPYTGQPKTSQTTTGAGIGAVGGAALGAVLGGEGDRVEGALIGAAAGALIGGGIGHHMDAQEAELRRKLDMAGVQVTRQGDLITLNLPRGIHFAKNSFVLTEDMKSRLNAIAEVIVQYDSSVLIEGHASFNEAGKRELSERRAQSVSNHLFARGISNARMRIVGYGDGSPLMGASPEENRRVVISLSPVRG